MIWSLRRDLYMAVSDDRGATWSPTAKLPPPVNSAHDERRPALSQDAEGRYVLAFASDRNLEHAHSVYVCWSDDLVNFSAPVRVAPGSAEPLRVVQRPDGTYLAYLFLVGYGTARAGVTYHAGLDRWGVSTSTDLVHWSSPVEIFPATIGAGRRRGERTIRRAHRPGFREPPDGPRHRNAPERAGDEGERGRGPVLEPTQVPFTFRVPSGRTGRRRPVDERVPGAFRRAGGRHLAMVHGLVARGVVLRPPAGDAWEQVATLAAQVPGRRPRRRFRPRGGLSLVLQPARRPASGDVDGATTTARWSPEGEPVLMSLYRYRWGDVGPTSAPDGPWPADSVDRPGRPRSSTQGRKRPAPDPALEALELRPRTTAADGGLAVLCCLTACATMIAPTPARSGEPARRGRGPSWSRRCTSGPTTPADAGIGESVADVLAVALSGRKGMAVVERRRLTDVLAEHKLTLSGLVDPATAARVGALLTADLVVAGSVVKETEGDRLRFAVHVVAVDGRRVVGAVEVVGPAADLDRVAVDLAGKVANLAGVELPSLRPEDLDDSPDGRLHLMRGVGLYHAKNYDRAIASCLRAVHLDPRLVEARLWVARSYLALGEADHARAELALLVPEPRRPAPCGPGRGLAEGLRPRRRPGGRTLSRGTGAVLIAIEAWRASEPGASPRPSPTPARPTAGSSPARHAVRLPLQPLSADRPVSRPSLAWQTALGFAAVLVGH